MQLDDEQRQKIAEARQQALATALEAFNKIDINGDGEVDRSEVMALAKAGTGLPEDVSQAKIDEFFAQFDENNDGRIQRQEWIDFFGRLFDAVIAQGLDGAQ